MKWSSVWVRPTTPLVTKLTICITTFFYARIELGGYEKKSCLGDDPTHKNHDKGDDVGQHFEDDDGKLDELDTAL